MRLLRLGAVALATASGVLALTASAAAAHPLGNFTSNTYAGLRVSSDRIAIDYVLDLAEVPAQQTMPAVDTDGDGSVSPAEKAAYEGTTCASLASGLSLSVRGERIAVTSDGGRLTFPPGLAGLSILRLECDLSAPVSRLGEVAFRDGNLEDRVGWHEVVAVGDGTTLEHASVPAASSSERLTSYPSGVPALDVRDATFTARPGGASAPTQSSGEGPAGSVPGADRATRLFASLVSDHDLTVGFAFVALGIAIALGGFHALAPGHGKTVMAAYVVGRKGGLRHAVGIGLAVAVTHTIGVLMLGLVLWTSEAFAAERIYPILGIASGLLVAAVGVSLLVRVVRAARAGTPVAGHAHGSGPGQHTHDWLDDLEHELAHARERELALVGAPHHHDHGHHHHRSVSDFPSVEREITHRTEQKRELGWGGIVAMGFAGGMVPSPSAVIVLLGALTLGRTWFGVTLVLAYGLGLALTLVLAGLVLVRAQTWLEPRLLRGGRFLRLAALLPAVTAIAVLGGGLLLAARAASSF